MRIHTGYTLTLAAGFLLALAAIAAFNYRIDPGRLFDDGAYAKSAADLMARNMDVLATNLDERSLQRFYAASVVNSPDVVVLGSSRIMQVDDTMLPDMRLYNAGVSTSTLPDFLALAEIFVARGKTKPRAMIIGIDPWLFEERPRNERWQTLNEEYRAMLNRLGNYIPLEAPAVGVERARALISIGYFERSLAAFNGDFDRLLDREAQRATPATAPQRDTATRRADGSITYGKAYRERSQKQITADALAQGAKHVTGILRFEALNADAIDLFDRLLGWLKKQQVQVMLFLPPFHPAHYGLVRERDASDSLDRITAVVKRLARKHGFTFAGDFNAARAGCESKEFWDGTHARPACLRRILSRHRHAFSS